MGYENMAPAEFDRLSEVIERAPRGNRAQQDAFLRSECGEGSWLYTQARTLLEFESRVSDRFLEAPRPRRRSKDDPKSIGRYRVIRSIGSGGMGDVYLARDDAAERDVAIKIIRAEAATPEIRRRFESEGAVLARMHHPGIATVYGVEHTDDGCPFIVMEYVPEPTDLIGYADAHALTVEQRLALMIDVGRAVHHAHQRGVIHRDLKPNNIVLASGTADAPRPKVIDFGVARLIDDALDASLQTRAGQVIGTRRYMAPEQRLDARDVDVRSDVYSLGLLLKELVTGRDDGDASVAREGDADAVAAADVVPRDVLTIIDIATAGDRERRYGSAEAFTTDLRRYLRREPIAARERSRRYVAARFVARHRLGVGLTAVTAAAFAVLLVVSVTQAVRATRAEQRLLHERFLGGVKAAAHDLDDLDVSGARRMIERLEDTSVDIETRLLRSRLDQSAIRIGALPGAAHDLAWLGGSSFAACLHDAGLAVIDVNGSATRVSRIDGSANGGPWRGVAGADGMIAAWSDTELVLRTSGAFEERLDSIELDGATLVAHSGDQLITLDDTGALRAYAFGDGVLQELSPEPCALATEFRPDRHARMAFSAATGVVAVGTDDSVEIFDVSDGAHRRSIRRGANAFRGPFALSPDGAWSAVVRDSGVAIVDVNTGAVRATITGLPSAPSAIEFSQDGTRLGIGCRNGVVDVIELRLDDVTAAPTPFTGWLGHESPVVALAFTEDGRLASADSARKDATVRVWPLEPHVDGGIALVHASGVTDSAYLNAHQLAALARGAPPRIWTFQDATAIARELDAPSDPYRVTVWNDGQRMAIGTVDGSLHVRDREEGERWSVSRQFGMPVEALAASPTGTFLAAAGIGRALEIMESETGVAFTEVKGKTYAALFRDDEEVITVGLDRMVRVAEVASGQVRRSRPLDASGLSLALAPHADRLFVGTSVGEVVVIDVESMAIIGTLHGHTQGVTALAVSADGTRLASGSDDGTTRVWDAERLEQLLTLRHDGPVHAIEFGPNDAELAIATRDGRLSIWGRHAPIEIDGSSGDDSE